MTDNEIIKALECCSCNSVDDCDDCPRFDVDDKTTVDCMCCLMREALDLINRKNAEIERLRAECGKQSALWSKHYESLFETTKETIRAEAIKEFAEKLRDKLLHNRSLSSRQFHRTLLDIDDIWKEMVGGSG